MGFFFQIIVIANQKKKQCGEGQHRLSSIEARIYLDLPWPTTRTPFQNPDAISAYHQTRAAHHGVTTSG